MTASRYRAIQALVVFVGWLLITSLFGKIWKASAGLSSLIHGVEPSYVAAIVFLAAAIAILGWRDLGLNRPQSTRSLLLLWFPGLYVLVFLAALAVVGYPALPPCWQFWSTPCSPASRARPVDSLTFSGCAPLRSGPAR